MGLNGLRVGFLGEGIVSGDFVNTFGPITRPLRNFCHILLRVLKQINPPLAFPG